MEHIKITAQAVAEAISIERARAAAEIEKLRAALKEIDAMDRCMHPLCRSTQAAQIARDALRACEHKEGKS